MRQEAGRSLGNVGSDKIATVFHADRLYVISDLHLGGRAGFQIFASTAELVRLVKHLCETDPDEVVGLVINGDFVDFLAEAPAACFDPIGASRKLDRILQDASFAPVVAALQQFAATPKRVLAVNLGNHDLELALPWVRERLIECLSGGDPHARASIRPALDGCGLLCQVGLATVLCLHGNEVDAWNVTDHEVIRRIGRDLSQNRSVDAWVPNAGTQLVVEVMNELKARFPFVDLLKPETSAVVPALLALDPSLLSRVHRVVRTSQRMFRDTARMATGFLESGDDSSTSTLETSEARLWEGDKPLPSGAAAATACYADALLDRAEERLRRNEEPLALINHDERAEYLGLADAAWSLIRGRSTSEVLREALEYLEEDRSFDLKHEDNTFRRIDELIGPQIDFVVVGHTHLERALRRRNGNGYYFNSGTWARLIQLNTSVRRDPVHFERVFTLFRKGTMAALDEEPGLVSRLNPVVSIWTNGQDVCGELRHVVMDASEVFAPVVGSRFTWS